MKSIRLISIALLFITQFHSNAQQITGKVYGYFGDEKEPLVGAAVYYLDSDLITTTDKDGWFQMDLLPQQFLVVEGVGFKPDTIHVAKSVFLEITMRTENALEEVELIERIKSTEINRKSANLEFNIGMKELAKAACCNLSESFETNPAIDASYADAVTGTRQIELLGLAGKYSQIQLEMIPYVRGISSNYGLTHIPGPWIKSMQLSKGAGSVVNGFESMTGQINIELHKPKDGPKLLLNTYANASGRVELNIVTAQKVSETWSTVVLAHASSRFQKNDNNNDGFLDMPLTQQINFVNKWKYSGDNGLNGQIGIRFLDDVMQGGQLDYDHNSSSAQTAWGSQINNKRYEVFGKLGYIIPNQNLSSIGLIYSVYHHQLDSKFGDNGYNSDQSSVYLNLIYQSIIGTSAHKYKVGASWVYDRFDKENLSLPEGEGFIRDYRQFYSIPGVFAEYTWNPIDKISLIAGTRVDLPYGLLEEVLISPRLHFRYSPFKKSTFRIGVGKGYRNPHLMEENLSILASSRKPANPYTTPIYFEGQFEESWNFGLSFVQNFRLNYRDGALIVDYFYTHFNNQLVRDMDYGPQLYDFYYVKNGSTSSTISIQADYEPLKRFDVRMAYKYQLVQTEYQSIGKQLVPLVPKNRVLFNVAYETRSRWKFDATWNWYDQKRIPTTESNPLQYRMKEMSPAYSMIAFQVNKTMGKFEVYVGGENMLDFRQDPAIIAADDPFGTYFDSNLVWGPIFGRMFYLGANFNL